MHASLQVAVKGQLSAAVMAKDKMQADYEQRLLMLMQELALERKTGLQHDRSTALTWLQKILAADGNARCRRCIAVWRANRQRDMTLVEAASAKRDGLARLGACLAHWMAQHQHGAVLQWRTSMRLTAAGEEIARAAQERELLTLHRGEAAKTRGMRVLRRAASSWRLENSLAAGLDRWRERSAVVANGRRSIGRVMLGTAQSETMKVS